MTIDVSTNINQDVNKDLVASEESQSQQVDQT